MDIWKPGVASWRVMCELPQLSLDPEILYRPFSTLSFGERTKVMLAVLFSGENDFLLIDEPTNHLDMASREIVKGYLAGKKSFILVSHDRDLLDACVDHVLVLNRATIEVQKGNFSSWWENKQRADAYSKAENEKHLKEIGKLKSAADRASRWAVIRTKGPRSDLTRSKSMTGQSQPVNQGSDPRFTKYLFAAERSHRRFVVEEERLSEVALFFVLLAGTGSRVGQHGHRDRLRL